MKYDVESGKVVKVAAANQGARFCTGVHTAENQKEVIGVSVAAAVTAWEAGLKIDALLFRRRTWSMRSNSDQGVEKRWVVPRKLPL